MCDGGETKHVRRILSHAYDARTTTMSVLISFFFRLGHFLISFLGLMMSRVESKELVQYTLSSWFHLICGLFRVS